MATIILGLPLLPLNRLTSRGLEIEGDVPVPKLVSGSRGGNGGCWIANAGTSLQCHASVTLLHVGSGPGEARAEATAQSRVNGSCGALGCPQIQNSGPQTGA